MKLYSISRIHLLAILTKFDKVQLQDAGEVFASGFITDEDAKNILALWPDSISEMNKKKVVKIYLSGNHSYITSINGKCSNEEISAYFVGQSFNIGAVNDDVRKCEKIEFLS